jgi:23S rRNA (cytidine1920-2'-O)/16S rRNA (cytidine1409-2'-O)-methyltransferase
VVALDVGHGQLHPKLRSHPRVTVFERSNVRVMTPETIGGTVDVVVADLSFISLSKVIPALARACRPGGRMILLVKPQFEAGRAEVSKGRGVITDPDIHVRVRGEVEECLVAAGTFVRGWTDSPITGADGNREFLVLAECPGEPEP